MKSSFIRVKKGKGSGGTSNQKKLASIAAIIAYALLIQTGGGEGSEFLLGASSVTLMQEVNFASGSQNPPLP